LLEARVHLHPGVGGFVDRAPGGLEVRIPAKMNTDSG
jgi:hypothetical protein